MILDDVRCGFRLNLGGSWELVGVRPDLTAFSKAIANGYALAAVTGKDRFRDAATRIFTTGSFWFQAIPMAAALATLRKLHAIDGVARMCARGVRLREGLQSPGGSPRHQDPPDGPPQMPLVLFEDDPEVTKGKFFCVEALKNAVLSASRPHHVPLLRPYRCRDRPGAGSNRRGLRRRGGEIRVSATAAAKLAEPAPVASPSLSDVIYRQLCERLMRGQLKPDQRLKIRDLALALGVSETPVREAIFQLVRDGAVELKPRHYLRVRRLSLAQYMELREMRLLLEPLAAERALPAMDRAAIAELARSHRRLVAAERARDFDTAVQANFDFHFGI